MQVGMGSNAVVSLGMQSFVVVSKGMGSIGL